MNSSNQIKTLRLQRAWSQEQLAEMAAVSVRTIQRIENGEQPSLETLSALAAVFEVNVADLTGNQQAGGDERDRRVADARQRLREEAGFYRSLLTAVIVCAILLTINRLTAADSRWALWVSALWGTLLIVRGLRLFVFADAIARWRQARLQRLLRK